MICHCNPKRTPTWLYCSHSIPLSSSLQQLLCYRDIMVNIIVWYRGRISSTCDWGFWCLQGDGLVELLWTNCTVCCSIGIGQVWFLWWLVLYILNKKVIVAYQRNKTKTKQISRPINVSSFSVFMLLTDDEKINIACIFHASQSYR